MELPESLFFDLIVCTVGRRDELGHLLDSLERQTYKSFRVVIVDQNEDDRLATVIAAHDSLEIERVSSARGLSRARNAGLAVANADVVAFPDDDCVYPQDLLEQIAGRLAVRPELDGISGRLIDSEGRSPERWPTDATILTRARIWHGGCSATLFFRRELLTRVGQFDEQMGLGAGTPWESGEEIEYLVRAIDSGAQIEFRSDVFVIHELTMRGLDAPALRARGRRDGASVLGPKRCFPQT